MATPNETRRVLIVDPAFLGDAVFDAALARAAKVRWPGAEVGLVLRPPAHHLVPFMPHVDRVHVFDKRGQDKGWSGLSRMAARVAEFNYDVALVPHPSVRSTWLVARAGIPWRIGSTDGWLARKFLSEHRKRDPRDGFVQSRLLLLGESAAPTLDGVMGCSVSPPAEGPRRIGLVLGSEWATKRWPVSRAAAWVRSLDARTHSVVLLGAASEAPLFDDLRSAIGSQCKVNLHDAVGGSIEDLVHKIASCHQLIAGDTGPLHIARALGVPTVALFGPTDAGVHTISEQDRVLTVDVDCRPCSLHGHRQCPKGHHRCLADLSEEQVQVALTQIGGPQ